MEALGAGELLLTSMDRDGTRDGYDLELTAAVAGAVSIPVIASGGVGRLEHLYEGLTRGRADAALAASIFHFGETTVREANDRGYDAVVLSDCVASYFPEFQRVALEMVKAQGGIFGWVSDSGRFLKGLAAATGKSPAGSTA